ncbi:ClpXP adapter SpxH family protein [Bacillus testis]|uniref:ClpXP adapter SpxH family protein n=1 Tax=Bacillus testis TaxID=1622072 RepID=UPI000AE32A5D|nr:ClpXP adapter SpxH family protein [Bacillus testis]
MSSQKTVFNFMDWLHAHHCSQVGKKPIEIYVFIDPLCPECWALEPVLKKLQMEYGKIINIKHVLSGKLASLNFHGSTRKTKKIKALCEKGVNRHDVTCAKCIPLSAPDIIMPYNASLAIKAAELQGKRNGIRFLRTLQEFLFLKRKNISDLSVLIECAQAAKIDIEEFKVDFRSNAAIKAFQCDLKITAEMDVQEIPTMVIFNENIEDEGIKVSGLYPYDVYLSILAEMFPSLPEPSPLPDIESFVRFYNVVATREVAVAYNLDDQTAEKELKKLLLQQIVLHLPTKKYGTFWKYNKAE